MEQAQRAERVQQSASVEKTRPAEVKPYFNNADGRTNVTDPVTQKGEVSKTTSTISGLLTNIEQGQAQLDRLINGGLAGQNFSNSELLALQAGMYKYSQEMELTSKVVEKATNGLKDTLKTQV